MSAHPAKIAVVSSQPVVVEGLTAMLSRHARSIRVVDPAGQPDSSDNSEPDVVLYDVLGLTEGDGSDLDRWVDSSAVVIALGRVLRPDLLAQALGRGADGFVSLGVDEAELVAAISSATTGWKPSDETPDPVVGASGSPARATALGNDLGLTPREVRIIALIAQGLSNDEIAARDFLSINSVKSYIRNAYAKIGVDSRSQAVAWALRHGYTTEGEQERP